jgi:hypothetical protein
VQINLRINGLKKQKLLAEDQAEVSNVRDQFNKTNFTIKNTRWCWALVA